MTTKKTRLNRKQEKELLAQTIQDLFKYTMRGGDAELLAAYLYRKGYRKVAPEFVPEDMPK